jgi:hypothetical protein
LKKPPNYVWTLFSNPAYFLVSPTSLTLLQQLFTDNPTVLYWNVTFSATVQGTTGSSSLIFKVKRAPTGGSCSVTPTSGIALSTVFSIQCTNWVDPDDAVTNYDLVGKQIY